MRLALLYSWDVYYARLVQLNEAAKCNRPERSYDINAQYYAYIVKSQQTRKMTLAQGHTRARRE